MARGRRNPQLWATCVAERTEISRHWLVCILHQLYRAVNCKCRGRRVTPPTRGRGRPRPGHIHCNYVYGQYGRSSTLTACRLSRRGRTRRAAGCCGGTAPPAALDGTATCRPTDRSCCRYTPDFSRRDWSWRWRLRPRNTVRCRKYTRGARDGGDARWRPPLCAALHTAWR